jgi:hypothetical protein
MYPRITFNEDKETFTEGDWDFPDRIRAAATRIPVELKQYLEAHPVARRNLDHVRWTADHGHSIAEIQYLWKKVQQIKDAATACSTEGRSEDCWSDDVVLEMLRLGADWSGLQSKVMVANLYVHMQAAEDKFTKISRKSVQVDEPALLPTRNSQRVTSMKVDYGYCLEPTFKEEELIENVLRNMPDDFPSISQSSTPMLRNEHSSATLRSKKPFGNKDPAPQLGIWCTAGLAKLSHLARNSRKKSDEGAMLQESVVPGHPCWSVEGNRWQLYMERRLSSAHTVSQSNRWALNQH